MNRWLLTTIGLALAGLCGAADTPRKEPTPEAERGEGVTLTIYNQNFAIVKERRRMDLPQGRGLVRFRDVAATIVPETVQFATLRQEDLARVVEQNYEFDLVNADKLLEKYIDREIAVVTKDGEEFKGRLLSYDAQQLVLRTAQGIDLVPRTGNIKDVKFSALPGGLLTRPTLVWQLDAKTGGQELVKIAYRADQMTWRVDYRARLNEAGDRLDLAGWVTVTNNTGTAFKNAQVKLMAGDVHVVQEPQAIDNVSRPGGMVNRAVRRPAVTEKSFAEYHLYELGRKTTLKDREIKQIELLDVEGIPVARKYAYRGDGNKVAVVMEFKNNDKVAPGLGIPLPKGPVRVFQKDVDGQLEFAGTDNLDHTPKDEFVNVRLGYAADLSAERKQTAQRGRVPQTEHDFEVRLRNHKTEDVTIDVIEPIQGFANWGLLKQSHSSIQRDVRMLVFPIQVKANSEVVLTYTIRYSR